MSAESDLGLSHEKLLFAVMSQKGDIQQPEDDLFSELSENEELAQLSNNLKIQFTETTQSIPLQSIPLVESLFPSKPNSSTSTKNHNRMKEQCETNGERSETISNSQQNSALLSDDPLAPTVGRLRPKRAAAK